MFENWKLRKFGEKKDTWPKDENGEQIKPAFLEHVSGSELDVSMALNLLKAFEIPVMYKYPNDGEFGKMIFGFAGTGVDVYVPETMLEEAKALLAAEPEDDEEEFSDDDL